MLANAEVSATNSLFVMASTVEGQFALEVQVRAFLYPVGEQLSELGLGCDARVLKEWALANRIQKGRQHAGRHAPDYAELAHASPGATMLRPACHRTAARVAGQPLLICPALKDL